MSVLTINGRELYYEQSGKGEVPVVFVHGFSCDGTDWRHQLKHLARYCTTVTLDLNGHGRSQTELDNCTINLKLRLFRMPDILLCWSTQQR